MIARRSATLIVLGLMAAGQLALASVAGRRDDRARLDARLELR
jgi:hypothetical protein